MPANPLPPSAQLFLARPDLSGLFYAAIMRDTRYRKLAPIDRYNYFPVSPLVAITWVFEGRIFDVDENRNRALKPLPNIFLTGPTNTPTTSWSDGPIQVMTLGIFPDAWHILTGVDPNSLKNKILPIEAHLPRPLLEHFCNLSSGSSLRNQFDQLQAVIAPYWQQNRPAKTPRHLWIEDWVRAIFLRAINSSAGKSTRQMQRRIKSLTGQTQGDLFRQARIEKLFGHSVNLSPGTSLAELSTEMGYADQSHMGREVRRITGVSPAKLNKLIKSDESYWCYRLLGQRF